ncbi:putative 37S ribosomal protein S26A, mitochondrial [Cyphellophora attinorum]|uniref:Putative 37S ribosomal protein S26A, mitochondrial n=1 Tax=Cyphellophora attinorum TaxID=1664694 RepID=A0A0N1P4I1_9EURO|nr:putative 37S ribosomal protein S26A, mitochondrial [Phialophora attinorum]KPI45740.1 putative 37S ribosomal protein S26A, mitochondrial [Phialophora attinorum]
MRTSFSKKSMNLPRLTSSQLARHSRNRDLHSVPPLGTPKDAIFTRYGVPGLFSKETYQETWQQYQTHLLNFVNNEVRGTTSETLSMKTLHEHTSRDRSKAELYNHAAQAHHNHFFFSGLSAAAKPAEPSTTLRGEIEQWFESVDHLGDEISHMAMSMFGNGYVWVLCANDEEKMWRVMCTYNAGSPLPNAHTKPHVDSRQLFSRGFTSGRIEQAEYRAGSFGNYSGQINRHFDAFIGTPVLCLKVWEHQYMRDYGLAGKEQYISNWWKRVDWNEVQNRFNVSSDITVDYKSAPPPSRSAQVEKMNEGMRNAFRRADGP